MGNYAYYQPNPAGKSVGDCTVRAIAKALGQTWEETYVGLSLEGFSRGDLPNADSVWGPYLKDHGFTRHWMPDDCPDCYTVADFAADMELLKEARAAAEELIAADPELKKPAHRLLKRRVRELFEENAELFN